MKKNDLTQVKSLDLKELILKSKTIRDEIAGLVIDLNMKKLKDLKSVSKKRIDLAQVLTVIRQKQLLMEVESRVESLESGVTSSEKLEKPKRVRKEKTSS